MKRILWRCASSAVIFGGEPRKKCFIHGFYQYTRRKSCMRRSESWLCRLHSGESFSASVPSCTIENPPPRVQFCKLKLKTRETSDRKKGVFMAFVNTIKECGPRFFVGESARVGSSLVSSRAHTEAQRLNEPNALRVLRFVSP